MTGKCDPCCQALFLLLVVALVVFVRKGFFFSFLFFLPLVTPNMHSFAPNHSPVVRTLPQSTSCNMSAAAKSKCCWWKQHLLSADSFEKKRLKPAHCFTDWQSNIFYSLVRNIQHPHFFPVIRRVPKVFFKASVEVLK